MLKNTLLASAMALSVYTLSTSAQAGHRPHGWYIGIEAGSTWMVDATVDDPVAANDEWEFDSGLAVLAEVGYRWENHWRLELEFGSRAADVDCISVNGGACNPGNFGDVTQFTQMFNVIHDIELSRSTALSVGLGLGGNFVDIDRAGFIEDDDYVLAAQAIFQLSHQLTERLDFVLSYRFMISDEPQFRTAAGTFDVENENHTVTVGLRFDLEGDDSAPAETPVVMSAPPPPPAADAAPMPKQYIVYFGFNKTSLSASAMEVIKDAAATAMHDGYVSILVTGHTDTSGSSSYNQELSLRRANVVTKALINEGIPAKGITASGQGESMLVVQTSDREKEPRNRRAEIELN
jgi:OmpA-OmpF porin, OOP family